jgi:general secretion pathway protein J
MKKHQNSHGFTLFEILIAIFIFSMVVAIVFGSFREISKGAGIINTSNDIYEMAQGFMTLIGRDLESVYVEQKPAYKKPVTAGTPDPFRITGKTEYVGSTSFPMVRFTSLSHLPVNRDNRGGIAEIVYYADKSDEYGMILRRSDRLFFYDEFVKKPVHPVVLRKIKSLAFKYIDAEGQEHDTWDSESGEFRYATPSAVGIRIEIDDDGRAMAFETRIQLRCVREKSD